MKTFKYLFRITLKAIVFVILLTAAIWITDNVFFPNKKSTVIYKNE